MREGMRFPRSVSWTWRSTGWTFVIVGTLLVILGIFLCPFASVQTIQAAYAFYDTARSTTQGTVQASGQEAYYCGDYCFVTICRTTVTFTPLGQSTSFTTADNLCNALDTGAQVEVLYDPNNPGMAKTSRQASADISNGILGTIIWSSIALWPVILVFWGLLATRK